VQYHTTDICNETPDFYSYGLLLNITDVTLG